MAANPGLVTVFGASGFLGRYVVRALTARGWRVRAAVRNPHTSHELKVMGDVGQVQLMQSNLRFPQSVARAVHSPPRTRSKRRHLTPVNCLWRGR